MPLPSYHNSYKSIMKKFDFQSLFVIINIQMKRWQGALVAIEP